MTYEACLRIWKLKPTGLVVRCRRDRGHDVEKVWHSNTKYYWPDEECE